MTDTTKRGAGRVPHEGPFSIGIPSAHAALRSTSSWIALNAAGLVFVLLLFIPSFARTVGVSFSHGAPATGLLMVAVAAATVIYRLTGLSRAYYVADTIEGLATEAFCAFLIMTSHNVIHFVWLFYFFHVVLTSAVGVTLRNFLIVIAGPMAVVILFALAGDAGPALVAALGCVIGIAFYLVVGRMYDELEVSRQREAGLRESLARLQVAEERTRIARDLHDGVAAQLSALVWRARVLASEEHGEGVAAELATFEKRVLTALDQLRDVVLGLRDAPDGWPRALAVLGDRCREICHGMECDFSSEGQMDIQTHAAVWAAVEPMVLELVRNAARHAGGSKVEVRLSAADDLAIEIRDDGRGMPSAARGESRGGLANVRARVQELRGHMTIGSESPGTSIRIRVPLALVTSAGERGARRIDVNAQPS
jgi:signal transduction histidine kinase